MNKPSLKSLLAVAGGLAIAIPGLTVAAAAQCRPMATCGAKACGAKACGAKACGAKACGAKACGAKACGAKPCAARKHVRKHAKRRVHAKKA